MEQIRRKHLEMIGYYQKQLQKRGIGLNGSSIGNSSSQDQTLDGSSPAGRAAKGRANAKKSFPSPATNAS